MNFDNKQLERWIDHELSFLRYYGFREDRQNLKINSDIYKDIRVIGYTKRPMSLEKRCIPVLIKSKMNIEVDSNTRIEDLETTQERNIYTYSPCELFFRMFPKRKKEIIDILKNDESNPSTKVFI